MLVLLIHASLSTYYQDTVMDYPSTHRHVISPGDEWIINSSFPRTIFSLNSIPGNAEFTVSDEDVVKTLRHSTSTTFQVLAGSWSSIAFRNLPSGTYEVSTIGLGNKCSSDVYVSNQNWASSPLNKEDRIVCGSGKECCFFIAGIPSEKINMQYLCTPSGYLTMLESNGLVYNDPRTGSEQSYSIQYKRFNCSMPLLVNYKGISTANAPYFQITSYST